MRKIPAALVAILGVGLLLPFSCARKTTTRAKTPAAVARDEKPIRQEQVEEPPTPKREPSKAEKEKKERPDEPEEAAQFHLLQRTGSPAGELPVERYLDAKDHAEKMLQFDVSRRATLGRGGKVRAAQTTQDLGLWTALGPGNIGGRTRSLLIHPDNPDIMWAGAVGGGVWKTKDGGQSWTPMADLLPSIGISAMALDPKNPDILYAGTGEYYTSSTLGNSIRGLGIFKSTDGGETWSRLSLIGTTSYFYINDIVVSPNDSRRIYVAHWGGVSRSVDGGATWVPVVSRASPNNGCQDLVIRTDKPEDWLLASCGTLATPATAIFRTVDGAGNLVWAEVFKAQNMGRTSLALAPSQQDTVYAMSANAASGDRQRSMLGIYRSTQAGEPASWETRVAADDANLLNVTQLSNPRELFDQVCFGGELTWASQGGYDNVIAVDPVNPEIVWTGGIDLMRSEDGGRNWGLASFWQLQPPRGAHADHHAIAFHPRYDGVGNQTLFDAGDGGIYRTLNARSPVATGARAACPPYATEVIWETLNNDYGVTQFYKGAIYPGGAMYFGGTQDNGTLRGSDGTGANSWREIRGGDGGSVSVDPTNPNILFNSFVRLSIGRSTTGSATFSPVTTGITEPSANFLFIAPVTMDPVEPKFLYTGAQTLWRTDNSGDRWAAASAAIPTANGTISAIAVAPSDPSKVLIATSRGFVYRTANGRTSTAATAWQSVRLRLGYLSWLAFDPADANIAYATFSQFKGVAADQHVYKSSDGGATWTGIDGRGEDSLPDIPVFTILPDPKDSRALYLGTDIGLFVSLDAGLTWTRDQNPFALAPTTALQIDRGAGVSNLFAFTMGRGVWKTNLPNSGTACEYKVTPAEEGPLAAAFNPTRDYRVEAGADCVWSVAPEARFGQARFASVAPATGKGNATFRVTMSLNPALLSRSSGVLAQGTRVAVDQSGAVLVSGNDERASAIEVKTPFAVIEDTTAMTTADSDPVHSCTQSKDSRSVWFRWTAPQAGTIRFGWRLLNPATGTEAGSVLLVASSVAPEIGCLLANRSATSTAVQNYTLPVIAGREYTFQLTARGDNAPGGEAFFYLALQ